METQKNILFFGFGKENSEIYHQQNSTAPQEQQLKSFKKVKNQIISLHLEVEEQQKININNSVWYCKFDKNGIYYMLEVGKQYPERHAYQFIRELQAHILTYQGIEEAQDADLKFHCKKKIGELIIKYNDLASIDKIAEANANLNEIKVDMQQNIGKIVGNGDQLEQLQGKSTALQKQSVNMKNQSKDLERLMYWRNMKLKIIIVVIIFCIAILILVPLAGGVADEIGSNDTSSDEKEEKRVLNSISTGLNTFMGNIIDQGFNVNKFLQSKK